MIRCDSYPILCQNWKLWNFHGQWQVYKSLNKQKSFLVFLNLFQFQHFTANPLDDSNEEISGQENGMEQEADKMEGLKNQTKNSNGNLQNQTQSPTKKRRKPLGASKRKNKSQNALVSTVQLFEFFFILTQTEIVYLRHS